MPDLAAKMEAAYHAEPAAAAGDAAARATVNEALALIRDFCFFFGLSEEDVPAY